MGKIGVNKCKNNGPYAQVYTSSLRSIGASQVSSHKKKCAEY